MNTQESDDKPVKTGMLDLPYEIYSQIYKKLPLKSIKTLSISQKHLYHTYENLNIRIADKIQFHSKFDVFEDHESLTTLKEVIIDLFDLNINYEKCIKFCLKQTQIERIKIIGIVNDKHFFQENIPHTILKHLKDIHISMITQSDENMDYLLPLVACSHVLEKITFEHGTLTREAMIEMSRSKTLRFLKLHNVIIYNLRAFRTLSTLLPNLEEFHYYNFCFIRIMAVIRTLEAIFGIIFAAPNLTKVKISTWQELNIDTLRETRLFKTEQNDFKLLKGNIVSFFSAVLPLMQHRDANTFELYYSNTNYPQIENEKASIRYKLRDNITNTIRIFEYSSY